MTLKEKYYYAKEMGYSSKTALKMRSYSVEDLKRCPLGKNYGTYNGKFRILKKRRISFHDNKAIQYSLTTFDYLDNALKYWETLNPSENEEYIMLEGHKQLKKKG